ncbi:class I SAM-dependent methyltransferase [Gordonia sp. VNQ95]|jgi:SAM-dependent methyltransferase|uniref:class I SAM-dependent methyltransferase n=1 Tax=Gordonia sp. VNQ95 TaxID=3156619 RepID=UPI0032B42B34
MGELLELDAAVVGSYLADATALISTALRRTPEVIVDLGAGTGVGTRALAAAFPGAEIVAVDASPEMAARLGANSPDARVVIADLDDGWPADIGDADVLWASASLHHVADPAALLRAARDRLRPGGVLAVIEMPHQPRFLPEPPDGAGVETRMEAIMAGRGYNSFPDWTDTIVDAGFAMAGTHTITIDIPETTDRTRAYARAWFTRVRSGLADDLAAEDLATVDDLLGEGPTSLATRSDLHIRTGRLVWIARTSHDTPHDHTPQNEEPS